MFAHGAEREGNLKDLVQVVQRCSGCAFDRDGLPGAIGVEEVTVVMVEGAHEPAGVDGDYDDEERQCQE